MPSEPESEVSGLITDLGAREVDVIHGSTGSTARPSNATVVHWIGSATPANAVTNDEWTDTSNKVVKRYNGSTWDSLGPTGGTAVIPARLVPSGGSGAVGVPNVQFNSTSSFTMTANRANYYPFFVQAPIAIDQILCEVTTATASSHVRFAIYNDDGTGQPSTLVTGSDTGSFDSSTTGVKTATVSVTLPAGQYLFWSNSDQTGPVLRSWKSNTWLLSGANLSSTVDQSYQTQTFGAPPSTGLAWTNSFGGGSGIGYVCFIRRSS